MDERMEPLRYLTVMWSFCYYNQISLKIFVKILNLECSTRATQAVSISEILSGV